MRRSAAAHLVLVVFGAVLASNGCVDLKIADPENPGGSSSADGGDGATGPGDSPDGGPGSDAPITPAHRPYYDDVQAALATKRFKGPTTGTNTRYWCTPSYFFWIDNDKTIHSWRGTTKARIDYVFKDTGFHDNFFPSDVFFAMDRPFVFVDIYNTNAANSLVTSLPYSDNYVAVNDGVLLLDQKLDFVDLGGTKVRRWNAASGMTEDITGVLPTRETATSFNDDILVIPGAKVAPYALHIVDVAKKTSTAVSFAGNQVQQTEASPDGLLVAYVNGGPNLRLYKGNKDDAASRIELKTEISTRPAYFEDPPTNGQEHELRPIFAQWGKRLLYASEFGVWSYDRASKTIEPVQLNAMKVPGSPDMMCVMRDAGLLLYMEHSDLAKQMWAVPLAAIFP